MSIIVIIPIGILILSFIIRIPISIGMLVGSILYFLFKGQDIGVVAQIVLGALYDKYVIMAVPLFIFTAKIMNAGRITATIFDFADGLIGRLKGGTGHVNVVASLIFSGMSGSAIADISGLGTVEIEAMREKGYEDGFSCAVTAASAIIGPIFPPSITMIYYSMLSGASLGALFLGGMVPGVLVAIFLMIYIAFIATKRKYPTGKRCPLREFILLTIRAFPALLTPVILLCGIYTGVMTPTECGAVAGFYALILSIFVYRFMDLKKFISVLIETIKMTGMVGMLVGSAVVFSHILAIEHIPELFLFGFLKVTTNRYLLLLLVNIMFLILGMFVDVSTSTLVFIPLILPLVERAGINLVHFGVVITLNMMIGMCTPPYGMGLFIVSGISNTPVFKVIKEILPMIFVLIIVLLLISFIPDIVMFIPNILWTRSF